MKMKKTKKNLFGYNRKTESFYRQFADENQIDCVQLALIDLLTSRGGSMTWTAVMAELPFPRWALLENARILRQDLILEMSQDTVSITDYGQYALEDFVQKFQKQLAQCISKISENESPCLQA